GLKIEGEEMPGADDDIALALAFGEGPERMRAARLEGDIAAAVAEPRDRDLADAAHPLAEDRAVVQLFGLAQGDRRHGRQPAARAARSSGVSAASSKP